MGRRKRSTLPKKTSRGKPKGQAPPRPLSDTGSAAAGKKRKRNANAAGSKLAQKSTKQSDKRKGSAQSGNNKRGARAGPAAKKARLEDAPPRRPQHSAEEDENSEEAEEEAGEEDLEFFNTNQQFASFLNEVDPTKLANLGNKVQRRASKKVETTVAATDNKDKPVKAKPVSLEAEWEIRSRTTRREWDDAPDVARLPVKDAHGNLVAATEYRKLGRVNAASDEEDNDDNGGEMNEVKGEDEVEAEMDEEDDENEEEDEEDEEEDSEGDEVDEVKIEEVVPKKLQGGATSKVVKELKQFHNRQEAAQKAKLHIAHLCTKITSDPEENIGFLKELTELCFEDDALTQKLAVLSLLEVFKDIIPGYRVRQPTNEEKKKEKVSKEVKKTREFEARLLTSYQKYLQKLEKIMKYKEVKGDEAPHVKVDINYRILAVKCMAELLRAVPHFNFTWNIISLLVPYLASNNADLRNHCIKAIHTVFENDKQGGTTRQTVKLIGQFVKSKNFRSRPETLEVLLHIKFTDMLKEGDVTLDSSKTQHLSKKERKKLTKKQYQAFKLMREVEAEMKEAEAAQSKEERKTIQTDILRSVFITYFRVLKRTTNSPLLPSVLRGLVRYTRFINLDFIQDIVSALRDLIGASSASPLPVPTQLQCAITALQMLQQDALMYNALNIDLKELYARLYELLPFIPTHSIGSPELIRSLLHCLSLMSKDKKQVSVNRMAGFAKRLMTISLCLPPNACLAIVSIVKEILSRHTRAQQLLDSEYVGSGTFMAEVTDPEHANPLAATLWEFPLISRAAHYHPSAADYAGRVVQALAAVADSGGGSSGSSGDRGVAVGRQSLVAVQAPGGVTSAAKSEAMALFKAFEFEAVGFNPPIPKPRAHPLEKMLRKQSKARRSRRQEFFIRPPAGEPTAFMHEATQATQAIGGGGLAELREQDRLWAQVYHDLDWL